MIWYGIPSEIVPKMSKMAFLSNKLINFHFLRLLEENMPLPEINQNLFYQACCLISKMEYRNEAPPKSRELYESSVIMKSFLPDGFTLPSRDYCGTFISYLNAMQMTNLENHLKLNFYKRFRDYVKIRTGERSNGGVVHAIMRDIFQPTHGNTSNSLIGVGSVAKSLVKI